MAVILMRFVISRFRGMKSGADGAELFHPFDRFIDSSIDENFAQLNYKQQIANKNIGLFCR